MREVGGRTHPLGHSISSRALVRMSAAFSIEDTIVIPWLAEMRQIMQGSLGHLRVPSYNSVTIRNVTLSHSVTNLQNYGFLCPCLCRNQSSVRRHGWVPLQSQVTYFSRPGERGRTPQPPAPLSPPDRLLSFDFDCTCGNCGNVRCWSVNGPIVPPPTWDLMSDRR